MISATLRIAARDLRRRWQHLLPAVVAVIVGTAAIATVGSLSASVRASVDARAQELLAADLQISGSTPLDVARLSILADPANTVTRSTEFVSMLRPVDGGDATVLAEVKAVSAGYPLYGTLTDADGQPLPLPTGDAAYVDPALMVRLGVAQGAVLQLGETTVRIAGVIGTEPDRSLAFVSLGPRLLINESLLPQTALLQQGSRIQYRTNVRVPAGSDVAALRATVVEALGDLPLTVRTAREGQSAFRRSLDILERFLSTIALLALLLAATGIALTIRLELLDRLQAFAALKVLGVHRWQLLGASLLTVLPLLLAGALLGIGGAFILQMWIAHSLAAYLPTGFDLRPDLLALLEALAASALVGVVAIIGPALDAARVAPLHVLRESTRPMRDPRTTGEYVVLAAAVLAGVGVVLLSVRSWAWGGAFLGGLVVLMALLGIAARGLLALIARIRARRLPLILACRHLVRAPRTSIPTIVALALGLLLAGTTLFLRTNLLDGISRPLQGDQPTLYLIGVQRSIAEDVRGALAPTPVAFEPVVRARIVAVNDVPIQRNAPEGSPSQGQATREFGLTYRDALGPDERVTDGNFWTSGQGGDEVSVEADLVDELDLALGDTITFDIQGARRTVAVTSVRRVTWETGRPNYVFVLPPSVLASAPQSLFAAVTLPQQDVAAAQTMLAERFPTVTSIDVTVAFGIVRSIVEQVSTAVGFLALFVLAVGLALLAGMVVGTRAERTRLVALLRLVGAAGRDVRAMLLWEYALLALGALVLAFVGASLVSWILVAWVFDLPWSIPWMPALLGAGAALLLTVGIGLLTVRPALRASPIAVLRRG